MNKFTFKKRIPTGLYCSFEKHYTDIKLNKKVVGSISESHSCKYLIRFMIEDNSESNCPFEWITLNYRGDSEKSAREFIKERTKHIQEKYDLYFHKD